MTDLISVIINVYNGEKFIERCLESIINQTYKNLEILIINDGSTDNTLKLCENYKDKRIRIINQENMGPTKSRYIGIKKAKGDYLYFVDADDFIANDVIEYLHNMCKKYNTKMSTCLPLDIFNYSFTVKNEKEEVNVISSKEMLKKVLINEERSLATWNKLIKKELFENIPFEDRIADDLVYTHKLVIKAEKIAYSNQIKYFCLKHKASITANENTERLIDNYVALTERYNYIKNLYPDVIENDIGMLLDISRLYITENKEIESFLKEQKALKLYNKLFSFEIFNYKMEIKKKVRLTLFRISPRLCKILAKKYRTIKYNY